MLNKRRATYYLLLINLALVLFISIRAGSADISRGARATTPMTVQRLEPPPSLAADTLLLNDFETPNDATNMYPQGGEYTLSLKPEHATHGRTSLLLDKVYESNVEVATVHFPRKWDGYDRLEFDVYNDSDAEGTVWVRFGDRYDAVRFYSTSQKFAQSYRLPPGASTVSIPLEEIKRAFGRIPQRKSLHFNFPADSGRRFFIDYLRVVKDDGSQ
jgi:hypothetical protein